MMKKLEKFFFEHRFFFYGGTLGMLVNVVLSLFGIALLWHLPVIFILTPIIFWLDEKYIKY